MNKSQKETKALLQTKNKKKMYTFAHGLLLNHINLGLLHQIPLTKLRKNQVLKLSDDPELSSTEKELDALSLFFEKSCIAGKWSPDDLVNQVLSKSIFFKFQNSKTNFYDP